MSKEYKLLATWEGSHGKTKEEIHDAQAIIGFLDALQGAVARDGLRIGEMFEVQVVEKTPKNPDATIGGY